MILWKMQLSLFLFLLELEFGYYLKYFIYLNIFLHMHETYYISISFFSKGNKYGIVVERSCYDVSPYMIKASPVLLISV